MRVNHKHPKSQNFPVPPFKQQVSHRTKIAVQTVYPIIMGKDTINFPFQLHHFCVGVFQRERAIQRPLSLDNKCTMFP